MITSIQWLNENEGRAYPVSEAASRRSNAGDLLPSDILVDMGILVPEGVTGVRLASVTISPALVSVVVSSDFGALLVGTYGVGEVKPYTPAPLTAVAPNCTGWFCLGGHAATTVEQYRFGTAQQSGLENRVVRFCKVPGVTELRRLDAITAASGLVTLQVAGGIMAQQDPQDPQNLILRLDQSVQDQYAKPCSGASVAPGCQLPVIRRICNVQPDQNGVITLRFC